MKNYAISQDVWKELEKIFELPKDVIEATIHLKYNEVVTIEITQLLKTTDGIEYNEVKKKWKLEEIKENE